MEIKITAVKLSHIPKVGAASATYAPQQSCPSDCAFMGSGCYAEGGNARFTTNRVNSGTSDTATPLQIAKAEAAAIDNLWGARVPGLDLRLHVVGDARTEPAAKVLGQAATRWKARGGGQPWTYTHAWRKVRRPAWGSDVSVLGSVDKPSDIRKAIAKGYAPALVVPEFPNGNKVFTVGGFRFIPCQEQTRGVTCIECRLCFDDAKLRKQGLGIAFAAHGSKKEAIKRRLTVV